MILRLLSVAWVYASCLVAMRPMRRQYVPGVILMLAAPVLIWFLVIEFGWLVCAFTLFAFLSTFRNPLRYFLRCALGQTPEIPT